MEREAVIEIGAVESTAYHPSASARRHRGGPVAARPIRRPMGGQVLNATVFAIAGFILGAVFWHFVGFWSFVSHMVLKGPEEQQFTAQKEARPGRPVKELGRLKDVAASRAIVPLVTTVKTTPEVADCTALAFDRKSGALLQVPCSELSRELPLAESQRTDLEPLPPAAAQPASWSVQVDAADTAAPR